MQASFSGRQCALPSFLRLLHSTAQIQDFCTQLLAIRAHFVAGCAGENETRALQMEIMKTTRIRPLTHDVAKNIIGALGFTITRIVITDIIQNT